MSSCDGYWDFASVNFTAAGELGVMNWPEILAACCYEFGHTL
jgi:hypothetical protein